MSEVARGKTAIAQISSACDRSVSLFLCYRTRPSKHPGTWAIPGCLSCVTGQRPEAV